MKARSGKLVVFLCGVALLVALGVYTKGGAGAGTQAVLEDVGRFRLGSRLGSERAGFSGRSKVEVFLSPLALDRAAVESCLQSPEVSAELFFYTPVLVDALDPTEADVESRARARGFQVVVRALDGKFLGGLAPGFSCGDLVSLLQGIRRTSLRKPSRSPVYRMLLETAEPIDLLEAEGNGEVAAKYVDFLREFEGATSPAVQAAEARLGG